MNAQSVKLGGLTCQSIDRLPDGEGPRCVVVFCHGFGAPGTDLVPLAGELLALNPALGKVRFLFPAAPLSLDEIGMYGGRAWWPLDVERLMLAIERGDFRDLRNERPPGLEESRDKLLQLIAEVCRQTGLPVSRLVLGGFSQGAMLTTDIALRLPESPAGLCILSGTLLDEAAWRELAARRGPLPVVQSHGRQDPILPFEAAVWLRDLLQEAGLPVEFVPFDGVHTISFEALHRCAALLGRIASERDGETERRSEGETGREPGEQERD